MFACLMCVFQTLKRRKQGNAIFLLHKVGVTLKLKSSQTLSAPLQDLIEV